MDAKCVTALRPSHPLAQPHTSDVALRRSTKQAAVFAAELRRAFVADLHRRAGRGIQAADGVSVDPVRVGHEDRLTVTSGRGYGRPRLPVRTTR